MGVERFSVTFVYDKLIVYRLTRSEEESRSPSRFRSGLSLRTGVVLQDTER